MSYEEKSSGQTTGVEIFRMVKGRAVLNAKIISELRIE